MINSGDGKIQENGKRKCLRKLLFTYPDLSISENFLGDQLSFFYLIADVSPLLANKVEKDSKEVPTSLSTPVFLSDWVKASLNPDVLFKHSCSYSLPLEVSRHKFRQHHISICNEKK